MSVYSSYEGYPFSVSDDHYEPARNEYRDYLDHQSFYSSRVPRSLPNGSYIDPQQVLLPDCLPVSYATMSPRTQTHGAPTMMNGHVTISPRSENLRPPLVMTVPRSSRNATLVRQADANSTHFELETAHHTSGRQRTESNVSQSMMSSAIPSPPSESPSDEYYSPTLGTTTKTATANRYYCQHPACIDDNGQHLKSFSRNADLVRHEKSNHGKNEKLDCPRRNCVRKGEHGFTRSDHLIEHRRGYHGEDIPKRRRTTEGSRKR